MQSTLEYLASDEALDSIARDSYWPKWDSPWWHMTALWELGEAARIPKPAVRAMVKALQTRYLTHFLLADEPVFDAQGRRLEEGCHCALGTMYQVLSEAGVDVDQEIPWIRQWLLRYQLADGGLSCDAGAYAAAPGAPVASSIVGTLPPLEAVLLHTRRPFTAEELRFLDRGAECLIGRSLMRGSHAEEREDESDWLEPCFPRFYLYDVLRGLSWLLRWAETRGKPLSRAAIEPVVSHLERRFSDGKIIKGRRSIDGIGSRVWNGHEWVRSPAASTFPLLEELGRVGEESPRLTAQWRDARDRLARLERQLS